MPRISKKTVTIGLVGLGISLILLTKWFTGYHRGFFSDSLASKAKGPPQAELKITEFLDFQCPACAKGAIFLNRFIKLYPDRVYLQIKYFPLGRIHKHAYRSALFAECAARQDKFWPFHDLLVKRQSQWKGLENADSFFMKLAKETELDLKQLDACLSNENVMDVIFKDKDEGKSLGVKSTPSYLINGKLVVGTKSLEKLLREHFEPEP